MIRSMRGSALGTGLRSRPRTLFLVSLITGVLALSSCSGATTSDGSSGRNPVRIGLSTGSLAIFMYYVADTLGFYEDEGLDVTITPTGGSADAAQQLASGNFDVAQASASAMAVIMQTEDVYPFYSVITKEYRDLVVLSDRDYESIEDLSGERIGVSDLAGGEVAVLRYLLAEAGLENQVEIVATGEEPAAVASALDQGRIAAYAGSKSGLIPIETLTDMSFKSIMPSTFGDGPVEALVATAKFSEDEEMLVKIARATARGTEFCAISIDACVNVLREDHPEMVADEETARQVIEVFVDLSTPPSEDGVAYYGPVDKEGWEQYIQIFSFGDDPLISAPEDIDLDALLVGGLQERINEFDRDEIRSLAEERA